MLTVAQLREHVKLTFTGITVEPVLFLYMLAVFAQYSLFQDLVYIKVCSEKYFDSPQICEDLHDVQYSQELEVVQKASSHLILLSTVSLVIPSLLVAIYLGSWSDRFGRKWPILFPPLGGCLACIVYIVIAVFSEAPVALICVASFLSGLTGGFVSCIMSCMTYVASVSSQKNRTIRISRLEAMISLGGTVGPFISGSMLEITGHAYAFLFMMGCYATSCLYVIFFVDDVVGIMPDVVNEEEIRGTTPCSVQSEEDQRKTLLVHSSVSSGELKKHEKDAITGSSDEDKECEKDFITHSSNSHDTSSVSDDDIKDMLEHGKSEESCCVKYFSAAHFIDAVRVVTKKRENNKRTCLILLIVAIYITMMITAGKQPNCFLENLLL